MQYKFWMGISGGSRVRLQRKYNNVSPRKKWQILKSNNGRRKKTISGVEYLERGKQEI